MAPAGAAIPCTVVRYPIKFRWVITGGHVHQHLIAQSIGDRLVRIRSVALEVAVHQQLAAQDISDHLVGIQLVVQEVVPEAEDTEDQTVSNRRMFSCTVLLLRHDLSNIFTY